MIKKLALAATLTAAAVTGASANSLNQGLYLLDTVIPGLEAELASGTALRDLYDSKWDLIRSGQTSNTSPWHFSDVKAAGQAHEAQYGSVRTMWSQGRNDVSNTIADLEAMLPAYAPAAMAAANSAVADLCSRYGIWQHHYDGSSEYHMFTGGHIAHGYVICTGPVDTSFETYFLQNMDQTAWTAYNNALRFGAQF